MQLPGFFFVFCCLWSLAQPRPQYDEANTALESQSDNCWASLDQTSWPQVISFDGTTSTIRIHLQQTKTVPPSAPNRVTECLKEQAAEMRWFYKFTLTRSYGNETMELTTLQPTVQELLNEVITFHYILLRGNYEVIIAKCDINRCDNETVIRSAQVPVIQTPAEVNSSWCLLNDTEGYLVQYLPVLLKSQSRLNFSFAFTPCHSVLPYEHADVSVYKSDDNNTCLENGLKIIHTKVQVQAAKLRNTDLHEAVIEYQTPKLDGNHYYCLRITSQHPFCRTNKPAPFLSDPGLTRTVDPDFCNFTTATVYMADLPFITQWVPFCTSHFQCGWLYVTVIGTAAFLLSFLLAFLCNYCCCKARRAPPPTSSNRCNELSPSNLDTLKLTDLKPKRTWHEVHEDFYKEPPANPGKILLLYSPDSVAFKELQASFRSFLELACHCVVLDLFDEELLQAIAYDPEAWIDQLLRDDRFKVIVVCSQGAYKRHQAILKGEVLNIPNTDSLDGLFSAGLRFLQARQYDSGRLALARYEMLHLSSEDFRFDDLGAAREFSVPSHLHELFCWIHDYDPLDLLGKPWVRYHLELQLLTDALKTARMERRK